MSLSGFLRSTLQLDPMRELRLVDEMALQREYLDIEKERFSDRMVVRIDVPAELEGAMVPSLILQPLIENAVKHGVGRSVGEVEIHIQASRVGEALILSVENDVTASVFGKAGEGLGIGLANVAHRVRTHFPEGASLTAGRVGPARYRVSLHMPLRIGQGEAEPTDNRPQARQSMLSDGASSDARWGKSGLAKKSSAATASQSGTTSHLSSGSKRSMKGTISSVFGPRSRS
ncbi:sensor histidine kinase [Ensifer sp. 2YAB10]|uniref:sensor histidine kinase n=1 Tax=unclassified Ensifer TaxID=2633371 RepID=UPI003F93542D